MVSLVRSRFRVLVLRRGPTAASKDRRCRSYERQRVKTAEEESGLSRWRLMLPLLSLSLSRSLKTVGAWQSKMTGPHTERCKMHSKALANRVTKLKASSNFCPDTEPSAIPVEGTMLFGN